MTILIDDNLVLLPAPVVGNTKRYIGLGPIPSIVGLCTGAQDDRIESGVVTSSGVPVGGRMVLAIDRRGGRLTSWTYSAADGTYSIPVDKYRDSFLVCLDDAAGTVQNDLIKRVLPQT